MSFLQNIAGPSRRYLVSEAPRRCFSYSVGRFALKAPPAVKVVQSHAPKPKPKPRAVARNQSSSESAPPTQSIHSGYKSRDDPDWPWEKEPSDPKEDYTEESRTIYARPLELWGGKPGTIKALWAFAGIVITFTILAPDNKEWAEVAEESSEVPGQEVVGRIENGQTPKPNFKEFLIGIKDSFSIWRAAIIISFGSAAYILTRIQANAVTRITQVRQTPKSPGLAERMKIRIRTGIHEANLPGPRYLEYDLSETKPRIVPGVGYLGLTAGSYPSYRIDLAQTALLDRAQGDVVVSLDRIKRVWGQVEVGERRRAPWQKLSERVDAWAMKEDAPKGSK